MNEQICIEIKPRKGMIGIDWKELWQYRDLFFFLIWRDILVRYKQTLLGAAWAVLQPLASMILFAIVFGRLARMPSEGLPYPLFAYAGLLIWTYFSHSMNQSAASLIADEKLVTKIYFPRMMIPVAPVIGALLDLAVSFGLLLLLMAFYRLPPSLNLWALPVALLLMIAAASGVGMWLSALNVKYRDFRYVIPFLTQFWMFASPVVYPVTLVPEHWRLLYALNPLTGAIEGFRWALLGAAVNPWPLMAVSAVSAATILVGGLIYFRSTERFFADFI
jgi:lipopolysaccharide transport system permease protein